MSGQPRGEAPAAAPEDGRSDLERAREYVQAARLVAVRTAPYFATPLLRMRERPSDAVPTFGVDRYWRVSWNPAYVMRVAAQPKGVSLLAGIWLHEVGHLLRDHGGRFDALAQPADRHVLFNVAGDVLINDDLDDMGVALPDRPVRLDDVPGSSADMTTEEIYWLLASSVRKSSIGQPSGPDCGSAAGGPMRSYESGDAEDRVGAAQADLVRRSVAADVREHARTHGVGSVAGAWLRWADDVLEPLVDWRTELRSLLRRDSSRAVGRRDLSYSRPSRRRPPGVILPAAVDAAPLRVTCVVDTSGSIGANQLAQALAEITALTRYVTDPAVGLTVIVCDLTPAPPIRIRDPRRLHDLPLAGGGGTDMGAGIAAAARQRPRPDTVIVLTDGFTPWPVEPPPDNPRAHYVAVLWADHPPVASVPSWIRSVPVGARARPK